MIELTEAPLDPSAVLALVADPECGAEVLFLGTTRQWTELPGQLAADSTADSTAESSARTQALTQPLPAPAAGRVETSHLVYESYREMALAQLQRLEAAARSRWPLRKVVIVHRLGHVPARQASVAIAVSSPHRSEAFEAARWLIDELKHHVPIWKQEHYVQHGSQWIHPTAGNCNCVGPALANPAQDLAAQDLAAHGRQPDHAAPDTRRPQSADGKEIK